MKENDDLTTLFQPLGDVKMQVKEGFWEGLEKDLTAVMAQTETMVPENRVVLRPIYQRWVAAASVLLIVAAGSIAFWTLNSQEQEIQQAFNEIVANADAVEVDDLTEPATPIIYNKEMSSIVNCQSSIVNRQSGLIPASLQKLTMMTKWYL